MQTGMLSVMGLVLIAFIFYYPRTVFHEEQYLAKHFGDAYASYQQRVPRWLPKSFQFPLPEALTISPKAMLQTTLDASLFFVALPLLTLLETLHVAHVVPTFFSVM